ncbi:MAG: hypothetical protein HYX79_00170 [Chloroflexi bacterium]|nr:hypothetical protein [Chloroflexota bacterium]
MLKIVITIIVVIGGLALAATIGPLKSWLPSLSTPPQQTPQATLTQPPPPPPSPTLTQPPSTIPTPTTAIKKITRTFTEKELQDAVNALIPTINKSGQAKIDYMQVKLEQDRMLVSAKGQALGITAEMKDAKLRFNGKTISAEAEIVAMGIPTVMTGVAEIQCVDGKPRIELTSFTTTNAMALRFALGGSPKDKIAQMVNDAIVSRGLTILCRVESISIENAKLTLVYTQ